MSKKKNNIVDIDIVYELKKNRLFSKTSKTKIDGDRNNLILDYIDKYLNIVGNIKYIIITDFLFDNDDIRKLLIPSDTLFVYIEDIDNDIINKIKTKFSDIKIYILDNTDYDLKFDKNKLEEKL